jgi:hypothetical protein
VNPNENTLNGSLNGHADDEPQPRSLIHLPRKDDLPPPEAKDIYAQAAALIRDNYDACYDLAASVGGDIVPPMHGSPKWSRIRLVLLLRDKCEQNGYSDLAVLNDAQFERAIVFGFRRTTKVSLPRLQKQGQRLMIERRRALTQQQAAE